MGILDPTTRADLPDDGPSDDELRVQQARRDMPPIEAIFNLEDFERVAKDVLAKTAWAYYEVRAGS
jgi:L-lactate dehydrogenase (cytochrome)